VEHRLCLTTITGLFAIITALSLSEERGLVEYKLLIRDIKFKGEATHLARLVLSDLVLRMLLAVLALAVGPACLRNVDLILSVSSYFLDLIAQFAKYDDR
jgi:hypothetical protein